MHDCISELPDAAGTNRERDAPGNRWSTRASPGGGSMKIIKIILSAFLRIDTDDIDTAKNRAEYFRGRAM